MIAITFPSRGGKPFAVRRTGGLPGRQVAFLLSKMIAKAALVFVVLDLMLELKSLYIFQD